MNENKIKAKLPFNIRIRLEVTIHEQASTAAEAISKIMQDMDNNDLPTEAANIFEIMVDF